MALRLAELLLARPEHPKHDADGEQLTLADGTPWHPHYENAVMFAHFTLTPHPKKANNCFVHFDTRGSGASAGHIYKTAAPHPHLHRHPGEPTMTTNYPVALRNRSIRIVTEPRWIAYYGGIGYAADPNVPRSIGLLIPGEPGHRYSRSVLRVWGGEVDEVRIGEIGGHHGYLYQAKASELGAEERRMLRNHWNTIKPGRSIHH